MNIESIPVRSIKKLAAVQPRFQIDSERVGDFAELLNETPEFDFPPLDVFRDPKTERLVLADGFTRHQAYLVADRARVACFVFEGDENAASWHALGANMRHGAPLTSEERKAAIYKALSHPNAADKTQEQIAQMLGVSTRTIGRAISDREQEKREKKAPKAKEGLSAEALEAINRIGHCSPGIKEAFLNGALKKPEDELIAYSELDCEQQARLAYAFLTLNMNLRTAQNVIRKRPQDPKQQVIDYLHYTRTMGESQSWTFFDDTMEMTITMLHEPARELARETTPPSNGVEEPAEEIF